MPGGKSGLFPSLEEARAARAKAEQMDLMRSAWKVVRCMTGESSLSVTELINVLSVCDRNGLRTLEDIYQAALKDAGGTDAGACFTLSWDADWGDEFPEEDD